MKPVLVKPGLFRDRREQARTPDWRQTIEPAGIGTLAERRSGRIIPICRGQRLFMSHPRFANAQAINAASFAAIDWRS